MAVLKQATLITLSLFSLSGFAETRDVEEVDPALTLVSSGFGYRVLVYARCSPEHCWSDIYLQRMLQSQERAVLCSSRLTEMKYGFSVTNVEWETSNARPRALLHASHSHTGSVLQPMALMPEEDCEYNLSQAEEGVQ